MLLAIGIDGMARVGTTLIAKNPVHIPAEGVHDLALALVTPLGTDDRDIRHTFSRILECATYLRFDVRGAFRRYAES